MPNGLSTTASWTLANPSDTYALNVHYARGGPCAADPSSDTGAPLYSLDGTQPPNAPSGSQTGADQLLPGAWVLCAWLQDTNTSTITVASLPVTVSSADTVTLAISPA